MAVRFVDPDEEQVVLQCPEPHCVWTKRLWRDGVVASLGGTRRWRSRSIRDSSTTPGSSERTCPNSD
jgi:hypothetical protein